MNFSYQPDKVAEVTPKSCFAVGEASWAAVKRGDSCRHSLPPHPPEHLGPRWKRADFCGGRFVTCFDSLLFVVPERNFLVTKSIVFNGIIRNNY